MKPTYHKPKYQHGFTLIEFALVLILIGVLSASWVHLQQTSVDESMAKHEATYLKNIGEAASKYINNNYAAVLSVASASNPALIRVQDLIASNDLKPGTLSTSPFQSNVCVLALETSPNVLSALVVAESSTGQNDVILSTIVNEIGASGGGIYSRDNTRIMGSYGTWNIPIGNYAAANQLGQRCDGTAGAVSLTEGHAVVALWFENNDTTSGMLYRDDVPTRPELNAMNTTLDMGDNDIDQAGNVDAGYVDVRPQDTSTQGGELRLRGAGTYREANIDNRANRLRVFSNGNERLNLDITNGRLGVGTNNGSPQAQLDVRASEYTGSTGTQGASINAQDTWASLNMNSPLSTKDLVMHYGSGNQLRIGRYGKNRGSWESNPVRLDLDAPDGSMVLDNTGQLVLSQQAQLKGGARLQDLGAISSPGRMILQAENNALHIQPYSGTTYIGYSGGDGNLNVNGTTTSNYLRPTATVTKGGSCSTNGLVAKDSSGNIMSCVSSVWKRVNYTDLETRVDWLEDFPGFAYNQGSWVTILSESHSSNAQDKLWTVYSRSGRNYQFRARLARDYWHGWVSSNTNRISLGYGNRDLFIFREVLPSDINFNGTTPSAYRLFREALSGTYAAGVEVQVLTP